MSHVDDVVERAVTRRAAPFVVAMAADRDGVTYEGAAGEANPGVSADQDTMFALWSMTKAIGSLALLTLVDRGEISMDTAVIDVLPEFGDLRVFEGVLDGNLQWRAPRSNATVQHLLTHTSGLGYPLFNRAMVDYMQATDLPYVMKGDIAELAFPLLYDPGTAWSYGIGLDWVGYLIERISGQPLPDFCRAAVLEPLGLSTLVFEAKDAPRPIASAWARRDDGFEPIEFAPPSQPELYGLGNALYGTAVDYLRFLRFVLRGGELDGIRLLRPETFELMVSNQIADLSVPTLRSTDAGVYRDADLHFSHTRMTHTAGFFRTEQDVPDLRRAGSLWWAGFLNTHYWVDRQAGIASVFMTQSLPFCDSSFMTAFGEFERAVYRSAKP